MVVTSFTSKRVGDRFVTEQFKAQLFDVKEGKALFEWPHEHFFSVATAAGRWLFTLDREKTLRVWDVDAAKPAGR